MQVSEIPADQLDPRHFIVEQAEAIAARVGDGIAINALSGGVDSAAVTMLGHRAIGDRLKTYIVDNALMREGEPEHIAAIFADLGVPVSVIDARDEFITALAGIVDPEQKREAVTQTFYKRVFGRLVRDSGAKFLLQGTILTDIDETVAGIKRQHNVFEQLGIDPAEAFGYEIIEPLVQLRKDGVRKVAQAAGLPEEIYNRMPFPGPARAARIIGEVTPAKLDIVRRCTLIVERELAGCGAFQYMAILHEDRVTGIRDGERDFGMQIELRCFDSVDARTATPTRLPWDTLERVASLITKDVAGVVSVTYNITPKPPSTMEAV